MTRTPDEHSVVTDAFDAIATAIIFDQTVTLVFEGQPWSDYFSRQHQRTDTFKNLSRKLQVLEDMGTDTLDINIIGKNKTQGSKILKRHLPSAHFIDTEKRKELVEDCDQILSF